MDSLSVLFSTYGLLTLLVLLCSLYVYYRFGYAPYHYFTSHGIPGPKPKPFIGSLDLIWKFGGNTAVLNSHLLKTYGPISGIYFTTKPFLLIADLNMIKDITVKEFDKFVDRTDSAAGFKVAVDGKEYVGVFVLSGEDWRKRRHSISPAFSSYKLKLMEPLIKESAVHLAEKISVLAEKGETVEVLGLYSKMTMEVILSTAFGRSVDVQGGKGGEIYEAACDVFAAFNGKQSVLIRIIQFLTISCPSIVPLLSPLMKYTGFMTSLPHLTKAALHIIEMRRKEEESASRTDLLQIMLNTGSKGSEDGLSTGDIVAEAVGFMLAAYETTSVALSFVTYLLAVNPDVQEKLVEEIHEYYNDNPDKSLYDATHEIDYLDMVVSETLRIYPPAPATIRLCNEDCVINGVTIKNGVQVIIPINDIHKNPEIWPEPEKFIPKRFTAEEKAKRHPCAYLPFGLGPRNCIGMRFALMEAKMALIEIVRNFKIELDPETKVPLETELGGTLRPKNGLRVVFHSRD